MQLELAAIIAAIRYMPDAEAEACLKAILESFPPKRLDRAIEIAKAVRESRIAVSARMPGVIR
ncbi:MAG: hypothetical protein Q8R28_11295 [Dehalococcoidia bacterium]|nr:hypothetical protein [Dehalococcoidia bacterium]